MTVQRRRFLANASGALAAGGAAAVVDAPYVIAQPKIQWRLSTSWPPGSRSLERCGGAVGEGRGRDEWWAVPDRGVPGRPDHAAAECFNAASQGTIEAFMASASYWAEPKKEPALEWFTTIPFGMNPEGMAAWYSQGDGRKLWEEAYAAFNLVPRQSTTYAPQMAGWFRKKMTTMGDYKGLKMRIGVPLGGKVYARAGGTAVLVPGAEIYSALERGVIDAAEWVGPHDDMKLGLHQTARYYYYRAGTSPAA
jgi:TRAP-type mannitol/chloroaromatic compound transport system substrate-binding protein